MRDDQWLTERLDHMWGLLFPDIERKNTVVIRFKGRWKNKFGHIKMLQNKNTEIVVNSLFAHELVPEGMIDGTIAHELVHYMHGFQSPHQRLYKHPHAGGIVNRELRKRGFGHVLALEKDFLKKDWLKIYQELTGKKKSDSFLQRLFG
ncbi:hypothetical protein HZA98_05225 [Candidatus Woesearchaeota archaeon]|nr:hypothetical protein [Candidatus Woesearchaeota archaeon]